MLTGAVAADGAHCPYPGWLLNWNGAGLNDI